MVDRLDPLVVGAGGAARTGRLTIVLAVFFALIYVASYLAHPDLPGNNLASPEGWWGAAWDQAKYLRSAQAIAHGDLSPDAHWYPMGYSLLGAIFVRLIPNHPFFIVDLLLLAGSACLFCLICESFDIGANPALILFFLSLMAPPRIWWSVVAPWNTAATTFYIYLALYISVRKEEPGYTGCVLAGLCLAATGFTRPPDLPMLAPIGIFLLYRLVSDGVDKQRAKQLIAGVAAFVALAGAYATLYLAIYGWRRTPYTELALGFGFNLRFIWQKLYTILVDPNPIYGEGAGLIHRSPWLLLSIPGLAAGILVSGWRWSVIPAVILIDVLVYTSYTDLYAHDLWNFGGIHYFTVCYPLLGLSAVQVVRLAWRRPLFALPALVVIAAAMSVGMIVVERGPGTVQALDDRSVTIQCAACKAARVIVLDPTHFGEAVAKDDPVEATLGSTPLREFADFRVTAVDGKLRFISSVDFGGQPVTITFSKPHGYSAENLPVARVLTPEFALRLPHLP